MKRRSFLTMIGAATAAPMLPSISTASTAATGYNRYMYGLGVFHARTRANLTTADLMMRLKISATQAEAMMGEMTARGVLTPALGAVRVAAQPVTEPKKYVRKALRKAREALLSDEPAQIEENVEGPNVTAPIVEPSEP